MRGKSFVQRLAGALVVLVVPLFGSASAAEAALPVDLNREITFSIPPQSLESALLRFSQQANVQLLTSSDELPDTASTGVNGRLAIGAALKALLRGTGLTYTVVQDGTVTISAGERRPPVSTSSMSGTVARGERIRLARVPEGDAQADMSGETEPAAKAAPADSAGIPEILVKGARSGNTDIRRTEDDVQPYVVFDAEEIGRSMAPDLETFLRTRLPMNQSRGSEGQDIFSSRGNQSTIDLRGLGADQTLVLVNGRRMPGVVNETDLGQPDINGIPLSAVERIEILPSTAGGIYGGGATGGVVNIILKRNYNDLELSARYDGTFDGGGAERRVDATAGFSLEGGRTHIMAMASYRDGNPLYVGDRDFAARARALQKRNNPAAFLALTDPVHGYTTNIRSTDGSNLVLKDVNGGMVSLGEPIAHVPVGYAGPGGDNGAAFLGTAGEYNLTPANDVLGDQYGLLHAPTVRSVQLSLRREFTDRIEAFVDASRYDNRSVRVGSFGVTSLVNVTVPEGANNPFDQAVELSVPLVGYDTDRIRTSTQSLSEQLSGGVIVRLPREWTVQGEVSLGRSNSTNLQPRELLSADGNAALIDGRLDPFSDVNAYPRDFAAYYPQEGGRNAGDFSAERENATLRLSGPLLQLPGGPLRLAALLERREQITGDRIAEYYPRGGGAPSFTYYPEIGSSTDSGYAELNAPLVSAANARPGLLGLDLRASYRYDKTRTRNRSFNELSVAVPSPDGPFPDVPYRINRVTGNQFTLGFRYTPIENVMLRLSYGEGILPPTPFQLGEAEASPFLAAFVLLRSIDPKRGGLPIDTTEFERLTLIGSPLLRPEHSASWSGGVIFTPASLPGFRLSVDYTRIEKSDEIGSLAPQALLDLEDEFPGVIVRNELSAADAALGYTGGTIRVFNAGPVNIAKSLMEDFDLQADYSWETAFGSFSANVMATVQPRLSLLPAPGGEEIDNVGYDNGPLKWRANAGLRFSRGSWDVGWHMQYYDASRVYTSTASQTSRDNAILGQGSAWIPTQTYHDVYGRYRFEGVSGFAGGLLENTELQVTVQNVLDTRPPILASSNYYVTGGYATEGDARLRRYSIAFTKRFGR